MVFRGSARPFWVQCPRNNCNPLQLQLPDKWNANWGTISGVTEKLLKYRTVSDLITATVERYPQSFKVGLKIFQRPSMPLIPLPENISIPMKGRNELLSCFKPSRTSAYPLHSSAELFPLPPRLAMTVISLTLAQKTNFWVCFSAKKQGISIILQNIAIRAQPKFKLSQIPSKATIARILKNSTIVLSRQNLEITKKVRIKQVKHHALEEALFDWVINQQYRRINISGETFCSKARRIQFQVIERLKGAEKSTLKVFDGWLNKFKSRWELRILRSHGESGDADMTVVFRDLPQIKNIGKLQGKWHF